MDAYTDILSILLFLLIALVGFGLRLKPLKNLSNSLSFFWGLYLVMFLLIGFAELLYISDIISLMSYEKSLKALLSTSSGLFFTIMCFMRTKEMTKRKVKTLIRLPLIAALFGMYLKFDQVFYVYSSFYCLSLFIFLNEAKTYRFLINKLIISLILALFVCFTLQESMLKLNLSLIFILVYNRRILSLVYLKMLSQKTSLESN